ncbi:MAG: hypothetical protein ACFFDT_00185 [Candidatus Hodarchaeota archaeon]
MNWKGVIVLNQYTPTELSLLIKQNYGQSEIKELINKLGKACSNATYRQCPACNLRHFKLFHVRNQGWFAKCIRCKNEIPLKELL